MQIHLRSKQLERERRQLLLYKERQIPRIKQVKVGKYLLQGKRDYKIEGKQLINGSFIF